MLTVAKVTGAVAAGYADYLEGKTTAGELGDYYLKVFMTWRSPTGG